MPADGAAFVASKIDAIAANPEVWAKTVFILNYDENDGIFDHVAPPVPPAGTPGEFVNGDARSARGSACPASSSRPGPPAAGCAASPSTTPRCSSFLEAVTGVREPNISDWRRRTFGDLTSAFRFGDGRRTRRPVSAGGGARAASAANCAVGASVPA
jgi:phospholipase C